MENYNLFMVFMSYVIAVIGSLLALFAVRAGLTKPTGERNSLVVLAAICLGGMGIWSMHFIGMLAFNMHNMAMNFNWWLTALSLIVGVVMVYVGLRIMTEGAFTIAKLIMSGFLVGSGVVAMHYTGMLAMNVQADAHWDSTIIAASVVIAIVASIAALWLAIHVKQMWQMVISALVMGVAVCGMHYTGMFAATFTHNEALAYIPPLDAVSSGLALIIAMIDTVLVVVTTIILMGHSEKQSTTGY